MTTDARPPNARSDDPHFLAYLIGGPLMVAVSVWAMNSTGRFFWVFALAGVIGFFFGIWRMLVSAARNPGRAAIAVALILLGGWAIVSNYWAIARVLTGVRPFAGRWTSPGHLFSIEFPKGWEKLARGGFIVYGAKPGRVDLEGVPGFGIAYYELKEDERTLAAFAARQHHVEISPPLGDLPQDFNSVMSRGKTCSRFLSKGNEWTIEGMTACVTETKAREAAGKELSDQAAARRGYTEYTPVVGQPRTLQPLTPTRVAGSEALEELIDDGKQAYLTTYLVVGGHGLVLMGIGESKTVETDSVTFREIAKTFRLETPQTP